MNFLKKFSDADTGDKNIDNLVADISKAWEKEIENK